MLDLGNKVRPWALSCDPKVSDYLYDLIWDDMIYPLNESLRSVRVAQSEEQLSSNQRAGGSSPSADAID